MTAGNSRTERVGRPFSAVVLAGERPGASPVAQAAGVCCKALAEVAGRPMVLRVLDTLEASAYAGVERVVLCGLPREALDAVPDLRERRDQGRFVWQQGQSTPSESTRSALNGLDEHERVLLTTADHALLRPEMVDFFCRHALSTSADLVVALARYETIAAALPGVRRTVTRFRDGGYCGCNLFAFLTPRSRAAADYWRRVEQQRKRPWRVIGLIGWGSVVQYLLGRLSLEQAVERLSRRMGIKIAVVLMPYPEAAVDVDTPEDWELVKHLAGDQGS